MKRFFSTFSLLMAVATSLVISNNYYKQKDAPYSAKNNTSIEKSIDLTEADVYQSKRNTAFVSLPH
ncbi:hypothetical protein [Marivirga arenosa]|uniref:Uncharacterized protein n=1 Tax=Marivirga arenosa TaxID=3059076 RepID=A0AA49GDQ2_9BACT|nr:MULTISPECIES: hypothetical protein [unclassified Marivirga]WKK80288.2 hypothetical protein QYS47_24450 [Marivirga sp. BKB1-2]WKK84701.1 hypothetical protein QYS48_21645 [Marivirga sp. ABR2-2]